VRLWLCVVGSSTRRAKVGFRMARRRVDWPIVVGKNLPAPRVARAPGRGGVVSVLEMAEELATYPNEDTACKRAVELARDRIGIERAAIYLEEGGTMRGTWGTGARGETTDEHELEFPVGGYEHDANQLAKEEKVRWLLLENAPQVAHVGDESIVLGYGWLALTPIRGPKGQLGVLFSDGALSRAPFSPARHVRLAILCSLLGSILERHRAESGLPGAEVRSGRTVAASVRKALKLMDKDLSLGTEDLAELAGTSPKQLARLFRKDIGESLVAFRNRRRVERFFAFTDGTSENLLQAALAAGFGSYAQFHRVFRALLGASPSEYLLGEEVRMTAKKLPK
jgi:AraC-like DNA-binding protein